MVQIFAARKRNIEFGAALAMFHLAEFHVPYPQVSVEVTE
jgi:hypothetical protein